MLEMNKTENQHSKRFPCERVEKGIFNYYFNVAVIIDL
jgi:hypothetical protein